MAEQLWKGRFSKAVDSRVNDFNSSIRFDQRMIAQDMRGSGVHAAMLAKQGIAVRAGLHCAPLAHESAGTLETGTVRVSFGWDNTSAQTEAFLSAATKFPRFRK